MKPSFAVASFVVAVAALSACTRPEPPKPAVAATQIAVTFTLPPTVEPEAVDRALTRQAEQELRRQGETGAVRSRVTAGSFTVEYESRLAEPLPQATQFAGVVTRTAEAAGLQVLQWRVTSTQTDASKR